MNDSCPECGESFNRETGFYFGAMYASYGLTVLYGIILFLILVVAFNFDVLVFLFSFTGSVVILLPFIYRKSRLIWINLFVSKKN